MFSKLCFAGALRVRDLYINQPTNTFYPDKIRLEELLQLYHYDGSSWVDCTTLVDTENDIICGEVTSLSPFAVFQGNPVQLVHQLVQQVLDLNLQSGIENSLDAKLDAVLKAIDDLNANNNVAAINVLGAFINAVEAQRGKKIPVGDADALIAAAQYIIDLLT